jgi:hypothetical protein
MLVQRGQWRSFRPLQTAALLLVASMAAAQGVAGARYRIAEADVTRELNVIGLNVGVSHVHLPAYISSAAQVPKLKIVTAESIGANQVRLKLSCPVASECIPFFATVDVKEPDLFSAEVRLKTQEAMGTNRKSTLPIGAAPIHETRLRVGSNAVLVIRDGHMDIRLLVLAIDSGAIGQQVRVCTLDRKKVFRATVTGDDTVMGMME